MDLCYWASNSQGPCSWSAFISAFGGVCTKTEMIWIVSNLCLAFDGCWWTAMQLHSTRCRLDNRLQRWPKQCSKYTCSEGSRTLLWSGPDHTLQNNTVRAVGHRWLASTLNQSQYWGWITNYRCCTQICLSFLFVKLVWSWSRSSQLCERNQSLSPNWTGAQLGGIIALSAQTSPSSLAARCN